MSPDEFKAMMQTILEPLIVRLDAAEALIKEQHEENFDLQAQLEKRVEIQRERQLEEARKRFRVSVAAEMFPKDKPWDDSDVDDALEIADALIAKGMS